MGRRLATRRKQRIVLNEAITNVRAQEINGLDFRTLASGINDGSIRPNELYLANPNALQQLLEQYARMVRHRYGTHDTGQTWSQAGEPIRDVFTGDTRIGIETAGHGIDRTDPDNPEYFPGGNQAYRAGMIDLLRGLYSTAATPSDVLGEANIDPSLTGGNPLIGIQNESAMNHELLKLLMLQYGTRDDIMRLVQDGHIDFADEDYQLEDGSNIALEHMRIHNRSAHTQYNRLIEEHGINFEYNFVIPEIPSPDPDNPYTLPASRDEMVERYATDTDGHAAGDRLISIKNPTEGPPTRNIDHPTVFDTDVERQGPAAPIEPILADQPEPEPEPVVEPEPEPVVEPEPEPVVEPEPEPVVEPPADLDAGEGAPSAIDRARAQEAGDAVADAATGQPPTDLDAGRGAPSAIDRVRAGTPPAASAGSADAYQQALSNLSRTEMQRILRGQTAAARSRAYDAAIEREQARREVERLGTSPTVDRGFLGGRGRRRQRAVDRSDTALQTLSGLGYVSGGVIDSEKATALMSQESYDDQGLEALQALRDYQSANAEIEAYTSPKERSIFDISAWGSDHSSDVHRVLDQQRRAQVARDRAEAAQAHLQSLEAASTRLSELPQGASLPDDFTAPAWDEDTLGSLEGSLREPVHEELSINKELLELLVKEELSKLNTIKIDKKMLHRIVAEEVKKEVNNG
jgi:hypothetical protein